MLPEGAPRLRLPRHVQREEARRMPLLLLLLWLLSAVALGVVASRGFVKAAREVPGGRGVRSASAFLLAAGPPGVVFLVSAFVLLQAAPAVQFNVGSSWRLSLWMFW